MSSVHQPIKKRVNDFFQNKSLEPDGLLFVVSVKFALEIIRY
jgi:hypothetical protein